MWKSSSVCVYIYTVHIIIFIIIVFVERDLTSSFSYNVCHMSSKSTFFHFGLMCWLASEKTRYTANSMTFLPFILCCNKKVPKVGCNKKNNNHTLLPLSTAIFSNLPSFVSALYTIFPVVGTLASWLLFFCAVWFLRFTLCMLVHMSFSLDVLPITSMIIFVSCDLVRNPQAQQVQRESVWRISRSFIYF